MPDHDFEKAIGERARELRLQPSPAVWEGVAAQLREKRRRRGIAWFYLAAAVIGITAGCWWLLQPGNLSTQHSGQEQLSAHAKLHPSTATQPAGNGGDAAARNLPAPPDEPASTTSHPAGSTEAHPGTAAQQPESAPGLTGNSTGTELRHPTGPEGLTETASATATASAATAGTVKGRRVNHHPPRVATGAATNTTAGATQTNAARNISNESYTTADELNTTLPLSREIYPYLGFYPGAAQSNGVQPPQKRKGDASLDAKLPATRISPEKISSRWSFALDLGAGRSSLNREIFENYKTSAMEYQANAMVPNGLAVIQRTPSEIKAGTSFMAGLQGSRALNKKLRLGIGVQYNYFSTHIKMGRIVDSSLALYNIGVDRVTSALAAAPNPGLKGEDFTNRYHYLQVPLELSWNIDRNKHWYWNNALVAGYLLSTDALQYDSDAGVYYPDDKSYRRWQFGLSTAVLYKLNPKSSWQLSAGPSVQYQLTPIDYSGDRRHLFVAGITTRIQFSAQSRGAMK